MTTGAFFAPVADLIIDRVARHFNVRPSQLRGPRKHRTLATARWVAMYLMQLKGGSSTQIGNALGRDHSTVLAGLTKLRALAAKYDDVRQTLDRLAGVPAPATCELVAAGAGL